MAEIMDLTHVDLSEIAKLLIVLGRSIEDEDALKDDIKKDFGFREDVIDELIVEMHRVEDAIQRSPELYIELESRMKGSSLHWVIYLLETAIRGGFKDDTSEQMFRDEELPYINLSSDMSESVMNGIRSITRDYLEPMEEH